MNGLAEVPLIAALGVGFVVAAFIVVMGRRARAARNQASAMSAAAVSAGRQAGRVDPFYDPFEQGSSSEARIAARRKGSIISVQVLPPGDGAVPFNASVVDRSVGGLRLESPVPLEAGSQVSVRPVGATPVVPWIHLTVRHCRRQENSWQLGCEFERTPPSTLLWQFG